MEVFRGGWGMLEEPRWGSYDGKSGMMDQVLVIHLQEMVIWEVTEVGFEDKFLRKW